MERASSRPSDRPPSHPYPSPYPPPAAQPAVHLPFSDPFHTTRDPFLPGAHNQRDSSGQSRAWLSQLPQGSNGAPHLQSLHHHPPPSLPASTLGPSFAPPSGGLTQMSLPYDASRRSSLGGATSPPQYGRSQSRPYFGTCSPRADSRELGPVEKPLNPFAKRAMPPPSPPQFPPSSTVSLPGSAPRGPPTSTPFAGMRDMNPNPRSSAGMSISSILGGDDERKSKGSPQSSASLANATPRSMRPPSPARARSSSMREGFLARDTSPMHRTGAFGEPRAASAFHDRAPENRRDGAFGSPQPPRESIHSFRNFQPDQPGFRTTVPESVLARPNSQPTERALPRRLDEAVHRDQLGDGRFTTFRNFGEPPPAAHRAEPPRHELPVSYHNGVTSQPRDREFGGAYPARDARQGAFRFDSGAHSGPREDDLGAFRPGGHYALGTAGDYAHSKHGPDAGREIPRSSPSDVNRQDRLRGILNERPMTFEEHQRIEAVHREQVRKPSDGSGHRALLNLSPDLNRKGRNSPLPQAVQGAQPRHVGPGGDNPGIKMEFGRMFSGLGSGVGSTTPTPAQALNGTSTPSRMSPMRPLDDSSARGLENDDGRGSGRSGRGGKGGRRPRDEVERVEGGRSTPDLARGNKRSKTTHHHHHHVHPHHHHHRHEPETQGGFNMLRFPSNPGSTNAATTTHFHHHHNGYTHPAHHHHHHAPRASAPAPRKNTITILSKKLLEENAHKPRKHLGSRLYSSRLSLPSGLTASLDARTKYSSETRPIPLFEGKENCTFTIRVPRWYFPSVRDGHPTEEPSPLEEICKYCELWGSEVYTDDSDVVAAAVHSGWLQGDFGEFNQDLHELIDDNGEPDDGEEPPVSILTRPKKPVQPLAGHDVHVTLLLLPRLTSYTGTMQNHIRSRDWGKDHDGMSFVIHRIDFVDEGPASRSIERTPAARKARIAAEEAKRKEAADSLLMFANGHRTNSVSVGA